EALTGRGGRPLDAGSGRDHRVPGPLPRLLGRLLDDGLGRLRGPAGGLEGVLDGGTRRARRLDEGAGGDGLAGPLPPAGVAPVGADVEDETQRRTDRGALACD